MGRKAKYTYEEKLEACGEYLSGKKSASEIAQELQMGKYGTSMVLDWSRKYQEQGPEILKEVSNNAAYTKEFKKKVVEDYLAEKGSLRDLAIKYGIRSKEQIRRWISKYNRNEELKDYDPHPEVYMAMKKKTTLEERKEIVEYCLDNNKDYKEAATKYGCSYSQVYQWVRRYENRGTDGLEDRRGKRKQEEELSDLEKAEKRIKQLEYELLLTQRENELLKKVEEYERRWLKAFQEPEESQ